MASIESIKSLLNSRFFKYGVPFFAFVIGGSFGVKEFTTLRYEHKRFKKIDREELKSVGIDIKPANDTTLESEYKKYEKEENIDDWKNVRGPRPWEEQSLDEIKKVKEIRQHKLQEKLKNL